VSTISSRFTVDWDNDGGDSPLNTLSGQQRTKVFRTASKLSDWAQAEPGLSTPVRRYLPASTSRRAITEGWDDDPEDKTDTSVPGTRGGGPF
jgi:hypothetical protein